VQANSALSKEFITLAEYLVQEGYRTTGFCNNPLVGVLDNGLRRGFENFYNYGGALTNAPYANGYVPRKIVSGFRKGYHKVIERIAAPIQQAVAGSPEIFDFVLNPKLVSWWTRYANFKGDGPASIEHTTQHLQSSADGPQFTFLNLMGTHLPYTPPEKFVRQFAPIINDDPEASAFMRDYNTRAFHWLLPMQDPYSELEAKTLSDMYDAEVAYQDHKLAKLLALLDKPEIRDNTLVIIASDHGEMLGEHNLMGHGIGLYQELIHVPMMIRFPGQSEGLTIEQHVSTTYLFHTVLEAAGISEIKPSFAQPISITDFSLRNIGSTTNYAPRRVFSEGYPPMNLIQIIERHEPTIMDAFNCKATVWAAYKDVFKLLRTEEVRDEMFDLNIDPFEMNQRKDLPEKLKQLKDQLEDHLVWAISRSTKELDNLTTNLHDEHVLERMRSLGYIE